MGNFSWTQTSETTVTQKFGSMEKFFTHFLAAEGTLGQFTIAGVNKFRFNGPRHDLEFRLRQTWRATRYHVPSIAALTGKDGKIFHVAGPEEVAAWEEETFIVHSHGVKSDQLFKTMTRTRVVSIHFLPGNDDVHELVIQAEHHHIDARGAFLVFDFFWTVFCDESLRQNLDWATETHRLPPVFDELVELPDLVTDEEKQIALDWISPLGSVKPVAVPIAAHRQANSPTTSLRSALRLSPNETDAVIKACKQHKVTVSAAWLAALTLAFASSHAAANPSQQGVLEPGSGLATFQAIDVRRFFPSTFDAREPPHRCVCYHTAIPTVVPVTLDANLLDMARDLTQYYNFSSGKGNVTPKRMKAWAPFLEMMTTAIAASNPKQSASLISSFGVIEEFEKHEYGATDGKPEIEIVDLWLGDTMASATQLWTLHTWRNQLEIAVTYNAAYYTNEEMDAVLSKWKGYLVDGLGVRVSNTGV